MREDTVIALGTAKGGFLLRDGTMEGPLFKGERVPSFALDTRGEVMRMLAGTVSEHWGPVVRASDDGGRTWSDPETRSLRFPADTAASVAQIWQLQPSTADDPDTVYAGVEPAAIFRSGDRGETWELVRGLWDHPHRAEWVPGFGGLGLHTILVDPRDPRRLHIAISAGGVYRTDDGGATWTARNVGVSTPPDHDQFPEFGQCVHKIGRDAQDPDRLFMQNHGGLYRSDDDGDTWNDIAHGVPSDFGFPIVTHPLVADTAYVIPLEADTYRCTAEARCRVYRTQDAGVSWVPLTDGLPQRDAHLAILRDAFCHDGADPLGLYFGTRTGEVFGSADEGESWELLAEHLPPVLCVRAAPVA
jgi:photosystem II stability/assembly factor-like uncharacterized protein